jgi:hypothetical protein
MDHIIRTEGGSQKKNMNGKFHTIRSAEKPRKNMEDIVRREALQGEEWGKGGMEAPFEGGQGPNGAQTPNMDGMDFQIYCLMWVNFHMENHHLMLYSKYEFRKNR